MVARPVGIGDFWLCLRWEACRKNIGGVDNGGQRMGSRYSGQDFNESSVKLLTATVVIDLAGGDPTKGCSFGVGSALAVAVALASRGVARWWLGRPGRRADLDDAVVMARNSDPVTESGRQLQILVDGLL